MRARTTLSSSPLFEDCVQVRTGTDYVDAMREECQRYVDLLGRRFPWAREVGLRFRVEWFPHDFGIYAQAVVWYDDADPLAEALAMWVEDHEPERWDDDQPVPQPDVTREED
ncbi:MAG: hypothetical protein GHCLOJNM_01546 [bacterium]|nr:hypothetical protein [bacterium]